MSIAAETTTSRRTDNRMWPWVLIAAGLLFVIGGALHPNEDSSLPDEEATAETLGAATWIPSHALLLISGIGFLIGLFLLVRSQVPLSTAARRAAWVATVGAGLYAVEGIFHLAAFADEDALLAGNATPFLSTHTTMAVVVYPLFTFAVAALAVLSRRALTHPVIGVLGAIGAVGFGVAPALVGLADIEALGWLFPVGGILMALWFTAVGVTALIRGSARRTGSAAAAH
ncbi:MAG: hypothetical protein M3313_01665 [Actinomycetota bacterium]|nr:hypothetical protein [Actinomycetota bacterium]